MAKGDLIYMCDTAPIYLDSLQVTALVELLESWGVWEGEASDLRSVDIQRFTDPSAKPGGVSTVARATGLMRKKADAVDFKGPVAVIGVEK